MTQNVDLSELWANADGAQTRPLRCWSKGELVLLILEAAGYPPPSKDVEPPDHKITIKDVLNSSREPESPEQAALRDAERRGRQGDRAYVGFLQECRVFQTKRDALRPAWAEFYEREGLPEHAARLANHRHVLTT